MREQINGDEGDELVALREENVRLKAEVEKMTNLYEVTRTDALRNGEDATRLKAEIEKLRTALQWYADPKRYEPHPHGLAFERRDLSYVARAALTQQEGDK